MAPLDQVGLAGIDVDQGSTVLQLTGVTLRWRFGIIIAAYMKNRDIEYTSLDQVECLSVAARRAVSTTGTVARLAVETLNQAGVPTEPNLGSLMDNLGMDDADIHEFCFCVHGPRMNGQRAAINLNRVRNRVLNG